MINSIFKGFNFFTKKGFFKIFVAYLLFGVYSYFILDYLNRVVESVDLTGVSFVNYTQFIINTLGLNLVWIILSVFGMVLLTVFLTFTVANTENKKEIEFFEGFKRSLRFSFLFLLVGVVMLLLFSVIGTYINVVTFILLILLTIVFVIIMFMFYIGNIYLGLFDLTVKEALEKSRGFIRKKFWTTLGFLILLAVVNFLIYYVLDFLYFNIFFYNTIAAIITIEIAYFLSSLYIINAFTLLIKDQKFK